MGLLAGCQSEDEEPESVENWLAHAKGYDDSIQYMIGNKSVAVTVGPDELNTPEHPQTSWNESQRHNNADDIYKFEPAAIKISPGTTVTWKWDGWGGHNVVATDEKFDSSDPKPNGIFTHTFKSPGTHYYYCEPHKESGMKGAVVVADSGTQSETSTH
ncbi:plastocyanin/azurin family copper-binding protein [Halocatena halophila]|uniref:plastocyanin/azurin family copper-binding protein n=1 Tax=Halocatena halophila TaxID=2814576 RepID=UPI002ED58A92